MFIKNFNSDLIVLTILFFTRFTSKFMSILFCSIFVKVSDTFILATFGTGFSAHIYYIPQNEFIAQVFAPAGISQVWNSVCILRVIFVNCPP